MRSAIQKLPAELREEYLRLDASLFRSRVELYVVVTTVIYFSVSLQYLFRKTVFLMDTFRSWELTLWAILLVGAFVCHRLNRRAVLRTHSKRAAMLYSGFFLWAFSGLAVVYPESSVVLPFFYGFALLVTALMIPWSLSEIAWLTALYTLAFISSYDYVVYFMHYPALHFPRFYAPVDGTIFILIASALALVIRRKEIERDIHNYALLKKVESQNSQMDRELDLARLVHKTLVPDSFSHEKADIWVSYIPMSYVSGDYAKFRFLDDNRLLVLISDVTGHGVAAALLVNRIHAEFERLLQEKPEPQVLLKRLNDFISRDFEGTNMYLSAFCGLLDFEKREFRYSNYGHPPQYLFRARGPSIQHLESQNTLLGVAQDGFASAKQGCVAFEPGDRLLLFTDGVIEAMDATGKAFGEKGLKDFLAQNHHLTDGRFNESLVRDLTTFRNAPFLDDIYILNIQTKSVERAAGTENRRRLSGASA